jgi:hypothetical protein
VYSTHFNTPIRSIVHLAPTSITITITRGIHTAP